MMMARLLSLQKKPDEAAPYLQAALRSIPRTSKPTLLSRVIWSGMAAVRKAIPLLERVVRVNSDLFEAKIQLASLYANTRRFPEAMRLARI